MTEALPAELRALDQWLTWKAEVRGGKRTKVPYSARGGRASVSDPATWSSYEDALRARASADGIGFVFTAEDPYVGVDLDDCVQGEDLDPGAEAIVRELDSYTEFSPSGTGVHTLLRGRLNGGRRRTRKTPWGGEFENYDAGRFFCMTGRRVRGTPAEIHERQAEHERVHARIFPAKDARASRSARAAAAPSSVDDRQLLELARNARNGSAFDALYSGRHSYSSQSEADLALCSLLAFWSGPDPQRIDGLFRGSGLMREKWDRQHGERTYGAMTVAKALEGRTDYFADGAPPARASDVRAPQDYVLGSDKKGPVLPSVPELADIAGHCAWLTAVFALDPRHPITSGERQGVFGPEGHLELRRAGAVSLRFEPVTKINTPRNLIEALASRLIPTDGRVPAFRAEHCRDIAYVVRMLCGTVDALSDEQEVAGIVGTFMHAAVLVEAELTSYGTGGQRYETAVALRRETDSNGRATSPPRYARDSNTGEFLIAVSDLVEAARRHVGSSLPRGWLDARMAAFGWRRISLDGHALPGREGRGSSHTRMSVYRGHLTIPDDTTTP